MSFEPIIRGEQKAATSAADVLGGYNLYTMVDRSFAVPVNRGPITELGLYSTVACQWRPKLVYDAGYGGFNAFYSHPSMVSHSGSGWEWVKVPRIAPNGGMPVHVAGYFAGNAYTSIPISPGPRSEYYGDAIGVAAFSHFDLSTPALGARTVGIKTPASFFTDFDANGYRENVGTYGQTWSIAGGKFTVSNYSVDDNNHIDGIGPVSLLLFLNKIGCRLGLPGSRFLRAADFRNARVTARVRGVNFDPKSATVVPWIQAPHPTDLTKFANWAMTGLPLNSYLADGQWHDLDFELDPDPLLWTYAGGSASRPQYQFLPLADTFVNGENFHILAHRAAGTPQPTGTLEWDYIGITVADIA